MPEGGKICPLCGGLGFIWTDKGVKRCKCAYEKFDVARYLNIPRRFRDAELSNLRKVFSPDTISGIKYYLQDFPKYYKDGIGLLLVGETGVGKTYAICAVLKYIYLKYRIRGYFVDTKELSIKLRESLAERRYASFIETLAKVPLLVLDDLGQEELTDWYKDVLVGLISTRYNEKRLTFFTTNLVPGFLAKEYNKVMNTKVYGFEVVKKDFQVQKKEKEQSLEGLELLEDRFGSHLVSRLAEMTYSVIVKGNDLRIKKVIV